MYAGSDPNATAAAVLPKLCVPGTLDADAAAAAAAVFQYQCKQ
jgi:hypothetical protein